MNRRPRLSAITMLLIAYAMLLAIPAYAYIDPNASSLLTQILTPLLVIAATAATFLRKQTGSALGWLADRTYRRKK